MSALPQPDVGSRPRNKGPVPAGAALPGEQTAVCPIGRRGHLLCSTQLHLTPQRGPHGGRGPRDRSASLPRPHGSTENPSVWTLGRDPSFKGSGRGNLCLWPELALEAMNLRYPIYSS